MTVNDLDSRGQYYWEIKHIHFVTMHSYVGQMEKVFEYFYGGLARLKNYKEYLKDEEVEINLDITGNTTHITITLSI